MQASRVTLGVCLCAMALLAPGVMEAQSVTISPGYTTVGVNGTVQYTATVTGLPSSSVTWSVVGVKGGNATYGTITSGGLYTAPAVIPANGITISALGSDNKTSAIVYVAVEPAGPTITAISPNPIPVGNYKITVTGSGFQKGAILRLPGVNLSTTFVNTTTLTAAGYQGSAGVGSFQVMNPGTLWGAPFNVQFVASVPNPSQTISPTSVTLMLGATQQFTSSGATSWSATAGSVSSTGFYTAPAAMPSSVSVTVTAKGPNGSATAKITLQAGDTTQSISPTTVSLKLGGTQQFTSTGATSWTAVFGTVTSAGFYTAPSTLPSGGVDTVSATGPSGTAAAKVTLTSAAPSPQVISPTSVTLNLGATQQFTSSGATSWTANFGMVNATGFYTAPLALPSGGTDTVTATGPGGSAKAAVTLVSPPPATAPVITGVGSNGQLPLGIFTTTIAGTGFTATSVAALNGIALSTTLANGSLTATGFYGVSGSANMTVSNGSTVSKPFPVQVGLTNAQVSAAAARRFLEQAAFGPTPTDAANVQSLGFQGWLNQQFTTPTVSSYSSITSSQGGMPALFLTNAVMNSDQLRQRVAFALSQIFVTSIAKLIWNDNMVLYQDMLLNDAFTNYRQIMADVTLSPAMGQYLDMANNAMANSATGSLANENYARELMQLFTIGTQMLNQDGSVQISNGLPIPTYSQSTIGEFARVYTGWTYAPAAGQPVQWNAYITSNGPMVPYPAEHDSGSKQLLNGYVSPAGITPLQDLNNALDNIFNHPNVGPFVGKLLIQHLVKSNPSPAYISRVAAAFNDNGQGVRGDMQAVLTAILVDPEARANDSGGSDQATDGHLQEPALFIAGMIRAFGGQMSTQNDFPWDLVNLDQDLFNSPSVFNYYSPTYAVPGTSLLGPEFEIHTPNNAIWRANVVAGLFSQWANPVQNYGTGTMVDLTAFVPLASTPATLVSALDLTLTHGTMPAGMKSQIVSAITADTGAALQRVEHASYLILTSSYYNVWH